MSFSNQHTPGYGDLVILDGPGTLRPVNQESATLDRTILGIPSENDEYTRCLTFYNPSTAQPSVHLTTEEFEDPIKTAPYEPSISSDNTGSRIVYTPQSGSDVPAGLHSQILSPRSVGSFEGGSSDGGSCHGKAERPHSPSVSACATFGTSSTPASLASAMDGNLMLAAESFAQTDLSPAVNLPFREHSNFNQDDFNYLGLIMKKEEEEKMSQRKGTRKTRRPRSAGTRHDPMGPRVSTRTGMDRAQSIEKTKMMRQLGVCLPCLVNHEPVSR